MPNPRFSNHVGLELATKPILEQFEPLIKNIIRRFRRNLSPRDNKILRAADSFQERFTLKTCLLFSSHRALRRQPGESDSALSAGSGIVTKAVVEVKRNRKNKETRELKENYVYDASLPSSIAGHLRMLGYDVVAKSTGGIAQNPGGVIEECFTGEKVFDGSAIRFGKSPSDAASMISNRFGPDAESICSIKWRGIDSGHTFGWKTTGGITEFFDCQQGYGSSVVEKSYWRLIDPTGPLTIARLDGSDPNWDALSKYFENRD